MTRWRIFGSILFAVVLVMGVWMYRASFTRSVDAYSAADFSLSSNGVTYAFDSISNVLIGSFALPNPALDTVILDGSGNAVAAKNTLTAFTSSHKMYDVDNDDVLDSTEGIILSANTTLESTDTVYTSITNALASIATTEGAGMLVYFDQGVTSSAYDAGEDIYRQIHSGSSGTTNDGATTMRTFESTMAFFDLDSDSILDVSTIVDVDLEGLFRDADGDSAPTAGDTAVGDFAPIGITALSTASNVCFDGSVVNDSEYDVNEVLWLDVAGDCASFTTSTDSILVGSAAPSGTSTEFGTEREIAFLDADLSGTFTCSRASTCEAFIYSGVNGTNLSTGTFPSPSNAFFDSSAEATDGIRTTGTAWDESGGLERVTNFSALLTSGEPKYVYTDATGDSLYTFTSGSNNEDIFQAVTLGATATTATGQLVRTFDAAEKVIMMPGIAVAAFTASTGAIVSSLDTTLTAGAMDGTGTDRVLAAGVVLDSVPSGNKFYDHDTSGTYVATDDVVLDTDSSGYFSADDLLTLQVAASGSGDDIGNAYLSRIDVYERSGNSCAGSGTDQLLGSDTSSPFLSQAISITKGPYAATDALASRTVCVYADIANNSVHGKIWTLTIPTSGAVFASGNSPASAFTAVSAPIQFVAALTATTTASNTSTAVTGPYTFTYTIAEDAVANGQGLFFATFPSGYTVASSSVTCTDDGVSVAVTSAVSGQTVTATNASGSTVASGSAISCTVASVINPTTVGTTGLFAIGAYTTSTSRALYADADNTVTLYASGGSSSSSSSSTPSTITLTAPNGGESFDASSTTSVTWTTTGSSISYVNILASTDGGVTWSTLAANESNDGTATVVLPNTATSSALIMIEGTDLVTTIDDDSSDVVFAIGDVSSDTNEEDTGETETDESSGVEESPTVETSTLATGTVVRLVDDPTVYFIDDGMVRHPFFDAQTYFTYRESFDDILYVSEDVLNQSTIGEPMPVNAGTILVKFESSPVVYTVNVSSDGSTVLSAIPDETTVLSAFGLMWTDHLISLSDAALPYLIILDSEESLESLTAYGEAPAFTDRWHLAYSDATEDPDGDGAATWLEASWGTAPYDSDTDNDGYHDKLEVDTGHNPFLGGGV